MVFETWASDAETFTATPVWPGPGAPRRFQTSRLLAVREHLPPAVDVACSTPGNAAVGGFPTAGSPTPCIAEEVRRNRPMFDYIVGKGLNTRQGLRKAFARGDTVDMPQTAIAVKGDWVPLVTLLRWVPATGGVERARQLYYTAVADSTEYALVSLHVASRQNPNWVWGTFEHELNPGRCDDLGCFDTFGAAAPAVAPARRAVDRQYGACEKTPAQAMLPYNPMGPPIPAALQGSRTFSCMWGVVNAK